MILVIFFLLVIAALLAGMSPIIGLMMSLIPDIVIVQSPSIIVGGYNIYILDLVSVCLLIVSTGRYFTNGSSYLKGSPSWRLLLLFSLVALVSFLRGAPIFGKTAVVYFRTDFYTISAIFYFSSFKYDRKELKRLFAALLCVVSTMAVIGLAKLLHLFTIPAALQTSVSEIQFTDIQRIFNSEQAMILEVSFLTLLVMLTMKRMRRSPLLMGILVFFFFLIVVTAVRSVWLATAVGMLTFLLAFRRNRFVSVVRILAGASFILFLAWAAGYQSTLRHVSELVYEGASDPFVNSTSTLAWRVQGWLATFDHLSLERYLIGNPYGTPKWRYVFGQNIDYSLHNYFLQLLFSVGILGLAPFALLQWRLIQDLCKQVNTAGEPWFSALLLSLLVALVSCLVYFLAYDGTYIYAVVVGIAISILSCQRFEQRISHVSIGSTV